jgi:D-beta-D-heptose 7-phosphate kinase/D-beta-D-heptose 1-phosphate adenosyltransferase
LASRRPACFHARGIGPSIALGNVSTSRRETLHRVVRGFYRIRMICAAMSDPTLLETLDSLGRPEVLVLGDLILDLYTWGDAERISQEAPVILLRADRHEKRLGGAANVCQMLRGLEANVTCAGVVGTDEAGNEVREMLHDAGVRCDVLLADERRPTTTKQRFIGRAASRHPHQILRVDSEIRDPIAPEMEARLIQRLTEQIQRYDAILISDYAKGVCTPSLLAAVIDAARTSGVPTVVDPVKSRDYTIYRGATAITPNRNEAEDATGRRIVAAADALAAGRQLCEYAELQMAVVTLDRDGMALVGPEGHGQIFPTKPRAVYDITGAGDMVLATFGICLAAGTAAEQAVQLANVAGGLEVEHVGVAVIRRDEIRSYLLAEQQPAAGKVLTQDRLVEQIQASRARGQRIVFTNGCFDLLHVGHITYLQQAASMGDVLVIGLNSDSSVRNLKGPKRPLINQQDRAALLAALACVDYVTVFDTPTPEALIQRLRPEVLVKGGDYRPDQIVGSQFVQSYGGQVVVTPIVKGISTTKIIENAAA